MLERPRLIARAKYAMFALMLTLVAGAAVACGSDDPQPGLAAEPTATLEATSTVAPASPVPATSTVAPATPLPATPVPPTAVPTVEPTPDSSKELFATVPGIVDPTNFGWPRTITTSTGTIEIAAPPERIYSLSLGHAEIIAALRGGDVLVATGSFFKNPATSAAHAEFEGLPDAGSDPEEILGLDPEIVITSAFTSADLVAQLVGVGINVVKADLEDSALGNVPNILFLGYMLGTEDRALELAAEVTRRVNAVTEPVDEANPVRPRVLSMSRYTSIFVAGEGSTEGGIIETAGAINAAAEAGIVSHQNIGIEGIAAMNPDIIFLAQPEESALALADELYADPALADVPAVVNRKILVSNPPFYTTLSHWNVRGIEESALIFFPDLFEDETFGDFSHP